MTKIGSNSGSVEGDRLKSFIERIERLQDEIDGYKLDQKEILAEAKGAGYDPKILRLVLRERRMSKEDREYRDDMFALYLAAIGM